MKEIYIELKQIFSFLLIFHTFYTVKKELLYCVNHEFTKIGAFGARRCETEIRKLKGEMISDDQWESYEMSQSNIAKFSNDLLIPCNKVMFLPTSEVMGS